MQESCSVIRQPGSIAGLRMITIGPRESRVRASVGPDAKGSRNARTHDEG